MRHRACSKQTSSRRTTSASTSAAAASGEGSTPLPPTAPLILTDAPAAVAVPEAVGDVVEVDELIDSVGTLGPPSVLPVLPKQQVRNGKLRQYADDLFGQTASTAELFTSRLDEADNTQRRFQDTSRRIRGRVSSTYLLNMEGPPYVDLPWCQRGPRQHSVRPAIAATGRAPSESGLCSAIATSSSLQCSPSAGRFDLQRLCSKQKLHGIATDAIISRTLFGVIVEISGSNRTSPFKIKDKNIRDGLKHGWVGTE